MHSTFSLSQALTQAAASGLDLVDAERLLMHALGHTHGQRAWLRAHGADALSATAKQAFDHLCLRRLSKEPLAYITGQRGFYGLDLQIDSRVLDPRPDTETLVDWALEVLNTTARPHVIDLGTGSGAIALAIQHERRDAHVTAVDASADALTVARANADRLQLAVQFVQGSWLTPIPFTRDSAPTSAEANLAAEAQTSGFDLIVSNPPYIAENDPHLPALVHEPAEALTSGPDGLNDIRLIISQSPTYLKPGGWLLLEHGYDQAEAVTALLHAKGFENVQSRNDLAGIARCTGGQKPIPGDRG